MAEEYRKTLVDVPQYRFRISSSSPFYTELLSMSNVRLVKHETGTFALRERCSAVATGTGTAGLEALFREKPVLLFGHTFYQHAKGIFSIRTRDDCKRAVEEIFTQGAKPTLKDARRFLKAIDDTRIETAIDWYIDISDRTVEENTKEFSKALTEKLQSL